ncbi:MAG: SGNH/GDSL hydrolase family protein [Clostridiales bacterium]|nr:SGNH/GDSL hydrolase family protein [Clostridiales bacterium]
MKDNTRGILKYVVSGLVVIGLSFAAVAGANRLMKDFIAAETSEIAAAREMAERVRLEAQKTEDEQERLRLELEALTLKAEQMEAFYQKYKDRHCYHYFGQYYEMFEQVYNADVIFIGTSHCAHGVNPLYLEEKMPEHSFFNFGLNGSVPSFYEDWYEIFKNEAKYPTPKVIVWCVDWFMCDDSWLWRRITFDSPADMPLGIMRAIVKDEKKNAPAAPADEEEPDADPAETAAPEDLPAPEKTVAEMLADSVKEHGILALDEHLTVLLINNPIFSSRDRIPEMIRFYLNGRHAEVETPAPVKPKIEGRLLTEADLVLPTYQHKTLYDKDHNITSEYYKGYIPWDVSFAGGTTQVGCIHNRREWRTFESLLDRFEADGIKLIFVECPEYSGWKSGDRKVHNHELAEVAEARGIPFLNYNDELASSLNDDNRNYSDWGHLSKRGSTAFSKQLAEDLAPVLAEVLGEEP